MSVEEMYLHMHAKLHDIVPDVELRYKAELACEINRLKKEKNAVVLGHNYMEPALFHSIPDYAGDSLELSRRAAQTDKDIIVFCGVKFMAETAKILNPAKTVLIPSPKAGCSLAASITADDVRALKQRFPGVPVVTYVNTYAEVKAESDIWAAIRLFFFPTSIWRKTSRAKPASISSSPRLSRCRKTAPLWIISLSAGTAAARCMINLPSKTLPTFGNNFRMS
jgi:hypothetical protein